MQQQLCSSCQKEIATIHVTDLKDGAVADQKHLCAGCAESLGVHGSKTAPLKLPAEFLEDLIGGLKSGAQPGGRGRREGPACPACGLTAAEFKVRGRLGCPRCYETFKTSLLPLLERVHDATSHRGRFPARGGDTPLPPDRMSDLQRRLAAAIEAENYEEAAQLRDRMRELQEGPGEKS